MKRLTIEQWEERYRVRNDKRFDQKNTMFNRPGWDADLNSKLPSWGFTGNIKDRPGYRLEDQALRWACRRGTMMTLFNIYKPNPNRETRVMMEALSKSNAGIPASSYVPPEGMRADTSDQELLTRKVKKAAIWFGANLVGICELDRRWIYSRTYDALPYTGPGGELDVGESISQEIPQGFQYVVVMAFEQDYDMMRYIPNYIGSATTSMGYSQMTITSNYVAAFIRFLGFKAIDCSVNDVALSIPMAMRAGLGELNRFGLLTTQPFGPRVRLTMVITDMPLIPDSPIEFGVEDFCKVCKKCVKACPSRAISDSNEPGTEAINISNSSGELKWRIDAEKCRMIWSRLNRPCTICVAVCPFNKVNSWPHGAVRWFIDHARWGNRFYVWADELLGYGKPKKADTFWEDWKPGKRPAY